MKEATGDLNMTVVVVLAVAAFAAFFFTVIWPIIQEGNDRSANCNKAVCANRPDPSNPGKVNCSYKDKNNVEQNIVCVWKG